MKKKIQHDAVNNQEDEDSSTHPVVFLNDETPGKREKISVENISIPHSPEGSNNTDESTHS